MSRDATRNSGQPVQELRVDGGARANDLLMQFQADLLGIPVIRPKLIETTALGAAYLAGLGCELYKSIDELSDLWQVGKRFEPKMPHAQAQAHMQRWERAVRQATTPYVFGASTMFRVIGLAIVIFVALLFALGMGEDVGRIVTHHMGH